MNRTQPTTAFRFRIYSVWVITLVIVVIVAGFSSTQAEAKSSSDPMQAKIRQLHQLVSSSKWNEAAVIAKQIAAFYDESGQYERAAQYYEQNAQYWEKYGKPSWGIVNSIRADHIRTEVELYAQVPADLERRAEKFEPLAGSYVGLFPAGKGFSGSPEGAEEAFGKKHAIYLTYSYFNNYYKDNTAFPVAYAQRIKQLGGALQIGWEPHAGLDEVQDDAYMRQFAREAAASGIPIFLRFACEMNGEWVPWFGDPEKYVEKWQLVHRIMAEEAPNVAMVWSPNFLPRDNIMPYYPGDEYVDWVGFSLYTIPFSHGERKPGGNPIDYLRPLYEQYSHKPIMISEGAISFYSYELDEDFTDWGVGQLANMYAYMPRMYPMLKSITYFDLDKRTTSYDNQNNNYDLHDSPEMLAAYKKFTSSPYFMTEVKTGATPKHPVAYKPIGQAGKLSGNTWLFTYVKLPLGEQPYAVHLYDGNGQLLKRVYSPPFDMAINMDELPDTGKLIVKVLDKKFHVLVTKEFAYER